MKWLPGVSNIVRRGILFFSVSLILSYAATIATDVFFAEIVLHNVSSSIMNPLKLTLIYTSLINLLFHLLNVVSEYQKEYLKKEKEAEELKNMHAQAELEAIKQQINPHFLFNNLNVLSGLVMQQSNNANSFIEAFSKVYMHVLTNHKKELIELRNELEFIQPYSYLLQQRFSEGLKLEIEIPEKYYGHYIIPAALQMLIENAIKHNVLSKKKPLHVKVYANGNNTISVINNLQPKIIPEVPSSHIGLSNIRKRYELIAGKDIDIIKNEETFAVSLPLIEISSYESADN